MRRHLAGREHAARPPLARELFLERDDGYVQKHRIAGPLIAELRQLPETISLETALDRLQSEEAPLFAARRSAVAVSFRVAPDLLGRVKREAARAGVPYQTFMKGILEAGISRLERRAAETKRPARRTAQHR